MNSLLHSGHSYKSQFKYEIHSSERQEFMARMIPIFLHRKNVLQETHNGVDGGIYLNPLDNLLFKLLK